MRRSVFLSDALRQGGQRLGRLVERPGSRAGAVEVFQRLAGARQRAREGAVEQAAIAAQAEQRCSPRNCADSDPLAVPR